MITEEMYLLAKQIVANYEQQLVADTKSRNYTYSDMKKCFQKGFERGIFAGDIIRHKEINDVPQPFNDFMSSEYDSLLNRT